jgi:hypothetical protein
MSLTPQRILEKIEQVEKDVQKLRAEGAEEKKVMTLIAYKEYLQDELKEAQRRYVAK